MLTDGAVRQFSGREFKSLGAATEKRRAAVSKLCGGTDRSFGIAVILKLVQFYCSELATVTVLGPPYTGRPDGPN